MVGNIKAVDKCINANGFKYLSFTEPNLEIVVLEVVKGLVIVFPGKCSNRTLMKKLKFISEGPYFSHYHYHNTDYKCQVSISDEQLCPVCCNDVLDCYYFDDACNTLNIWKTNAWLSAIPEPILGLRNLVILSLARNRPTELPDSLGKVKNLNQCI